MFAFQLALKLGYVDVDGMLDSIPYPLFLEWMGYNKIDPIQSWREDFRAGLIASVIANVKRDPRKTSAFKPYDFMPQFYQLAKGPVVNLVDKIKIAFSGAKRKRK